MIVTGFVQIIHHICVETKQYLQALTGALYVIMRTILVKTLTPALEMIQKGK